MASIGTVQLVGQANGTFPEVETNTLALRANLRPRLQASLTNPIAYFMAGGTATPANARVGLATAGAVVCALMVAPATTIFAVVNRIQASLLVQTGSDASNASGWILSAQRFTGGVGLAGTNTGTIVPSVATNKLITDERQPIAQALFNYGTAASGQTSGSSIVTGGTGDTTRYSSVSGGAPTLSAFNQVVPWTTLYEARFGEYPIVLMGGDAVQVLSAPTGSLVTTAISTFAGFAVYWTEYYNSDFDQ